MLALITQTLIRKKVAIIVYCLAGVLILWMYVAMYPTFSEQAEKFEEAFNSYPEEIFQAFGVEDIGFDSTEKFIGMEHYSIIWPLMLLFMMISLAGFLLAAEVEKGTLSLILARPISRTKIFLSRYLAGLIILIIFCVISIFAVVPLAELHNVDYNIKGHISIFILSFPFGWAIYSLAMMFSAFFSEKSKLYMVMGGTLITMYVFNVAANLKENWKNLKYFSFFNYYDYNGALIENTISNQSIFIFTAVIIISLFCGLLIFNKRDVAI